VFGTNLEVLISIFVVDKERSRLGSVGIGSINEEPFVIEFLVFDDVVGVFG
jgi:hypothetical protein